MICLLYNSPDQVRYVFKAVEIMGVVGLDVCGLNDYLNGMKIMAAVRDMISNNGAGYVFEVLDGDLYLGNNTPVVKVVDSVSFEKIDFANFVPKNTVFSEQLKNMPFLKLVIRKEGLGYSNPQKKAA